MATLEGRAGEELATFYARRMAAGFGAKASLRAERKKAEAEADRDAERARFWDAVLRWLGAILPTAVRCALTFGVGEPWCPTPRGTSGLKPPSDRAP
jgi:hypothetical protein